ncbi:hypothetical protein ACU6QR_00715, partial [Aeromonas veronii]|uniref:hypothetical protein n=1 Tax=Aeromonas veronii TaxID=654 RepID=UPI00406C2E2B
MASLEEAKARLAQASQRFHDTEIKWQPSLWDSSDFDLRSPTGDPLGNIFSSIFGTRPLSPPAPQMLINLEWLSIFLVSGINIVTISAYR